MKVRIDKLLVEWGMAPSRTKAQEMIEGKTVCQRQSAGDSRVVLSVKEQFLPEQKTEFFITESDLLKYVSRGGLKLEGALQKLNLSAQGLRFLDIGLSTGGFADCLLKGGATEVVGVDVGRDQLHPQLLNNPHLVALDQINAKELARHPEMQIYKGHFDGIVMDVSFISATLIISQMNYFLKDESFVLLLIKPQFELQKSDLNRQGLVKDHGQYEEVKVKILACLEKYNFAVKDYFEADLKGKDGNQEFFVYAKKI